MWTKSWREEVLNRLQNSSETWDILIIGGGITGAGIFAEAARYPLKILLVDQNDFAWGTSSRSSKMIHGGLRYLAQGNVLLTWHAAREREYLLKKYPGLIKPLSFLLPIYEGRQPSKWLAMLGIAAYDFLAGHWNHSYWGVEKLLSEVPNLAKEQLKGALHFNEASTDDARLVLRLIMDAASDHAIPLNYVRVQELIKDQKGVCGALLKDASTGFEFEIKSKLVINATGVWADYLREQLAEKPCMRPLRGSHIIFPAEVFPLDHTVSVLHPEDKRPIFVSPWLGATLVGTTDLDYHDSLAEEPAITEQEEAYLLNGIAQFFPTLSIKQKDILSTFAGIRPVVGTGKAKPSQESRDTVMWLEKGLLTVTGGKLTTFRYVAKKALAKLKNYLPQLKNPLMHEEDRSPNAEEFSKPDLKRIWEYYGHKAVAAMSRYSEEDLKPIKHTPVLWGELRWAAQNESVMHLDDLLLRRTRIGLLLPEGGKEILEEVSRICRDELNWTPNQWEEEKQRYLKNWKKHYSLPEE